MNFLKDLLNSIGLPFLEATILDMEIKQLGHKHKPDVQRALTIPNEADLRVTCLRLGRDFDEAKAERDKAAGAMADFVIYLATGTVATPE